MEWISVNDRLPENKNDIVICLSERKRVFAGIFTRAVPCFGTLFRDVTKRKVETKCTHWMPLPEPPKEEEE